MGNGQGADVKGATVPDLTTLLAWLPHPERWPGVAARLRGLGTAAVRIGLPVRIAAAVGGPVDLGPHVRTLRCDLSSGAAWPSAARLARYRHLHAAVPPGTCRIVLRLAGTADPSLPWWLERWGRRTISEHHGDTVAERRAASGAIRASCEALGLRVLLAGVAGHIGITPEIAALHTRLAPPGLPHGWTGNGIDVAGTPATGHRPFAGGPLHLAAVLGNAAPWHGLDRLLAGLSAHRGRPVLLHLVGDIEPPGRRGVGPAAELIAHGRLAGAALDAVLSDVHLGIASLAMHRAGLRQACPLKSREYAARGLPFAYAYDDPDLPADLPWCLRLPGGDAPIAIEPILAFASGLPEGAAAALRAFAVQRLDWSVPLRRTHAIALGICG